MDPVDPGFNVRPRPDVACAWRVAGPAGVPSGRGPLGIDVGSGTAAPAWGSALGAFLQQVRFTQLRAH